MGVIWSQKCIEKTQKDSEQVKVAILVAGFLVSIFVWVAIYTNSGRGPPR
jgi:hypothetical protein